HPGGLKIPMMATPIALRDRQPMRSVSKEGNSSMLTLRVRKGARRALTLLEVLLALTIFLFAMVAIGRLITMGADRALDIQGRETQLCQAKLAEVTSGATDLASAEGDFEEDPEWHWAVDAQQSGYTNLWNVKVTVSRKHSDGTKTEAILTQ